MDECSPIYTPINHVEARLVFFELNENSEYSNECRSAWQQKQQKALSSSRPRWHASLREACSG